MATNVCTILLDAYVPEHHLVAVDGCLQSQANFQNLSTVRRRVYALPLHESWGALLSARGRAGYAVTLYGDTFERRYFEGMLRFHQFHKNGTFGELTAKPLPEAVDLPLGRRFDELDRSVGQAPYLQRTIYVALFGQYAKRERREWLERALGEAADDGWRAALKHGLGVGFVLAENVEALAACAAEGALSAVVATLSDLPSVIRARDVSVADGTRGALIVPGAAQGGMEMVNDAVSVMVSPFELRSRVARRRGAPVLPHRRRGRPYGCSRLKSSISLAAALRNSAVSPSPASNCALSTRIVRGTA